VERDPFYQFHHFSFVSLNFAYLILSQRNLHHHRRIHHFQNRHHQTHLCFFIALIPLVAPVVFSILLVAALRAFSIYRQIITLACHLVPELF
jgi:hypothetical protein